MEFTLSFEGDTKLLKLGQIASRIDSEVIPIGMKKAVSFLEGYIKKNKLSGQVLKVRSGRLRSSITNRVFLSGKDLAGQVGTNVVYAKIHEIGGTLIPKNSRFLTVPLSAAKTPAGVTRFSARQVISNPSAYGYQGTFFRKHILFGKKTNRITPLFVLKSSVKIPRRSYMQPALGETKPQIRQIFVNEFQKVIRQL